MEWFNGRKDEDKKKLLNVIFSFGFLHEFEGSKKLLNVIFSFGFLHEFEGSVDWLPGWGYPPWFEDAGKRKSVVEQFHYAGGERQEQLSDHLKACDNHVANYNLFYWNGRPIAVYRKSSYINEVSPERTDAFLYEIGNWRTQILNDDPLASALFGGDEPLIVVRICGDWNVPGRYIEVREDGQQIGDLDADKILMDQLQKAAFLLTTGDGAPVRQAGDLKASLADELEHVKKMPWIFLDNKKGWSQILREPGQSVPIHDTDIQYDGESLVAVAEHPASARSGCGSTVAEHHASARRAHGSTVAKSPASARRGGGSTVAKSPASARRAHGSTVA